LDPFNHPRNPVFTGVLVQLPVAMKTDDNLDATPAQRSDVRIQKLLIQSQAAIQIIPLTLFPLKSSENAG
jgi:hypothetical protein